MGYLCTNFSLPRPLCSRLRPDVRDRQTSDIKQTSDAHHHLIPFILGWGITNGELNASQLKICCSLQQYQVLDRVSDHFLDRSLSEIRSTRYNWCASGCVVQCRICNREVTGSNLGWGYFVPRSTQPSIPPGSVNEYQLRLGRQRQV